MLPYLLSVYRIYIVLSFVDLLALLSCYLLSIYRINIVLSFVDLFALLSCYQLPMCREHVALSIVSLSSTCCSITCQSIVIIKLRYHLVNLAYLLYCYHLVDLVVFILCYHCLIYWLYFLAIVLSYLSLIVLRCQCLIYRHHIPCHLWSIYRHHIALSLVNLSY